MGKSGLLAPEKPTKRNQKPTSKSIPVKGQTGYYVVETEEEFDLENDFHDITDEQAEAARLASIKTKQPKGSKNIH